MYPSEGPSLLRLSGLPTNVAGGTTIQEQCPFGGPCSRGGGHSPGPQGEGGFITRERGGEGTVPRRKHQAGPGAVTPGGDRETTGVEGAALSEPLTNVPPSTTCPFSPLLQTPHLPHGVTWMSEGTGERVQRGSDQTRGGLGATLDSRPCSTERWLQAE